MSSCLYQQIKADGVCAIHKEFEMKPFAITERLDKKKNLFVLSLILIDPWFVDPL